MSNEGPIPIPPRTSMTSLGESSRRSSTTETRSSRTSHSSSTTKTKERTKTSSSRELALLLAIEKQRSEALQLALDEANKQISIQSLRIEEIENNLIEVTSAFMKANKERLEALQNAAIVAEERELYRIQLLAAQSDIEKARLLIRSIDERRVRAETDAEKYKRSARKLREEHLVIVAREEGRREGFKEGLQRARAEVGFLDIAADGYVTPQTRTPPDTVADLMESEDGFTYNSAEDDLEGPGPSEPSSMPSQPVHQAIPETQPPQPPPPPPLRETTPVPTPQNNDTDQIHPVILHNYPISPRHPPVVIPPEGLIPINNEFGINIPPPHELSPMPPIIDSPAPSQRIIEEEPPRVIPPPGSFRGSIHGYPHPDYYRSSSPESNSTAMSQFDMLAEPQSMMANLSPLSAIEEVASYQSSPNPPSMHGGDLQRDNSMASSHHSPPTNPPYSYTPRVQSENLPDSSQRVGRKSSMTSTASSKRTAKTPPPTNTFNQRPFSPPQVGHIYSNPRYQSSSSSDSQEYTRPAPSERSQGGRPVQTPTQRSHTPYAQTEPPFVPPGPSYTPSESNRKPSRKSSMASAASTRTYGTSRHSSKSPTPTVGGIYTTLAPGSQTAINSPQQSDSTDEINVSIRSPTPPGSSRNEDGSRQPTPLKEFLSEQDALHPIPMPGSPRTQSPSPRMHPVGLDPAPLPTAPFGSPSIGTPIALGTGGIFIPSAFTPIPNSGSALPVVSSPGTAASSAPGGYSYNSSLGIPSSSQRPVIPDPELLGPADSDSDSDDRISSGMASEANTLTTPPTVAKGLPAQRGRGGARGKAATTGKKKKR